MEKSIIVYGPQGCGKTRNAEALAKHYGLSKIVEWDDAPHSQPNFKDTLYLTNGEVRGNKIRAIPFDRAMRDAGLRGGARA